MTIVYVRSIMGAAIQAYGQIRKCTKIEFSDKVPLEKVLGGILVDPIFEAERRSLVGMPQIVLTEFSSVDLRRYYELEKIAYEIWRVSAHLRFIAKGGAIIVLEYPSEEEQLGNDELESLISNYDNRLKLKDGMLVSSTGTVFYGTNSEITKFDYVLVPSINATKNTAKGNKEIFRDHFGIEFMNDVESNFYWSILEIGDYYKNHLPFADAFRNKHGVSLESVLMIIAIICIESNSAFTKSVDYFWRMMQRAYEGPYVRDQYLAKVKSWVDIGRKLLNISPDIELDLDAGFTFWELDESKRINIDLLFPGPHAIFIPFEEDRILIDYAWIAHRLYHLFYGIELSDQNFKGELLEISIRKRASYLPYVPLKSISKESRQIDASYSDGRTLIIIECKAIWHSIGFERGDMNAINYRIKKIDKAIDQIDDKAYWLKENQVGTNYDIRRHEKILPLVVTPFVEYIYSIRPKYWLNESIPRIMTPSELDDLLGQFDDSNIKQNFVYL